MTALFNFQSLLLVLLLTICTSAYFHAIFPRVMDQNKDNYFVSPFWKCARVGERLSPYVSMACLVMAVCMLFLGLGGFGQRDEMGSEERKRRTDRCWAGLGVRFQRVGRV
ncbi:DUF1242-domain-containing protein [Lophiostoma macrostomum CBS 122681]|uniref:DUF1242-domain-containing protein n=1 Tax=Lophiostoma macrostomum CBS 122681 TaxID=1314788 RepID=A0A6A6TT38_9PLEO|nr:DUF1242-domain-containing protein [Lophiostoma macrostomum CBS 122681]